MTDQDALDLATHRRMQLLAKMGHRFVLTALGAPKAKLQEVNLASAGVMGIETNLSTTRFQTSIQKLIDFKTATALQVFWCKIHTYDDSHYDGKHFSHFVKSGFTIEDLVSQASVIREALDSKAIDGITVRIESDQHLLDVAPILNTFAKEHRCKIIASLKLSGPSIAQSNDDEAALIEKVCAAMLYSKTSDSVQYIFDTFMDVDRGYYPRRAFIDRQFNPNIAAHVFAQLNSLFSNAKSVGIDTNRSIKGSQIVFTADGQDNHIHFGASDSISLKHKQLQNISEVIDLTSSGREQILPSTDKNINRKTVQTNPQTNAVLYRLT